MSNPAAGYFVSEFNRRLGQYTRNPAARTPDEAITLSLSARQLNERQREKAAEKLARQERAEKLFLEGQEAPKNGASGIASDPKFGNLSQETANLLSNKENAEYERPNSGWMAKLDLPEFVPGNKGISDMAGVVAGTAASPMLWALDKLARVSYAGFNAQEEWLKNIKEGDFTGAVTETPKAIKQGLTKEDRPGFGEVVEEFSSMPQMPGVPFSGFNNLRMMTQGTKAEKPTELFVDNSKRAGGLAGEIGADPMNLVGGKVVTSVGGVMDAAKGGRAIKAGEVSAEDAYLALVRDAVDSSIDEAGLADEFDKLGPVGRPDPNRPGKMISPNLPVGRTAVHDAAQRGYENSTLRIGGGATQGRMLGADIGSHAVADNVANEVRNFKLQTFDESYAAFEDILSTGGTLTKAEIKKLRRDPFMARYLDELLDLTQKAHKTTGSSLSDIEKVLENYAPKGKDKILQLSNEAAELTKKELDNTINGVRKNIYNKLEGQVKNYPGIRIGNKTIPFKRLGNAYHGAKARYGNPLEGVQYANQFPSVTPQIANRVKSTGQDAYEAFHGDVQKIVRGLKLTKSERRAINQRILTNTPAPTNRERVAQDFIKRAYRQIWNEEVDAGLRSVDDVMPDNYVYNYYKAKGGKKYIQDIDTFRKGVKLDVKNSKRLAPNHISAAQGRGLKVEQDAFRALLYRKLKSNRKLTQAWFKDSLLDNFGIMANRMSPELANKNRLIALESNLTEARKTGMEAGDKWYLPQDIATVYKKYMDMTAGNATNEMSEFVHMLDTVTRWFKQSATIYYPGFHVRNSMGDMFMSFIDGVRAQDYVNFKRLIKKTRNNPEATERIAGIDFTWAQLKDLFEKNVSTGGFKRSDFDTPDITSKLNPNKLSNKIREASEKREDFFRQTHFMHAFKEELAHARKTIKDPDIAIRNATRASAYRVNKYLFDYGATTLVEKKFLKRVFPFYTYARKAMPALVEGMFLHPSQFSKADRFFLDDDDGSYADMLTPDYQREMGYRNLSGDDAENPLLLGGAWLPTDVLNKNTNFMDPGGFMRNIIAQSNPVAKAVPELAYGKKAFNQAPVGSPGSYLSDSFAPPVKVLQDLAGTAQAAPGIPDLDKYPLMPESGDKMDLLSKRFGLGLPLNRVTNSQQTATLYGLLEAQKAEFSKLNGKLEENGYRIYVSPRKDGASFRIRNESTGDVVLDTTSVQEALERAKALSK